MSTRKGHTRLFNTETDILPLQLALDLVLSLLNDVVVHCRSCNTDMRARVYADTNFQLLTLCMKQNNNSSWVTKEGHHPINLLLGETHVYSMSKTLNVLYHSA